jgi:hypothetical protein
MPLADVGGLQDQLQALLDEAGEEAQAALGVKPTPAGAAAAGAATTTAASSRPGVSTRGSWFSRSRGTLLLLLAGLCILLGSMVAVQMLPVTVLPPGAMCTPQNAAACKAALAAQLAAADKEPSRLRRAMLEAKWYAQDVFTIFWTRRLPEGVTLDQAQQVWLSNVSSKQIAKMTTAEAEALFGSVPEHLRSPAISAKLAASAAQKAQLDAARKAAERAEVQRIAAAKAEAERRTAEEARIAREKAEAARLAKEAEEQRKAQEKAEAERVAREKAEAEQRAQEKADAERRAAEQARLAEERAEAARQAAERAEAERKAEQARLAAEAAEAERLATERAASAEREAAARLASEQAERAAAAAAKAKRRAALLLPIMVRGLAALLADRGRAEHSWGCVYACWVRAALWV